VLDTTRRSKIFVLVSVIVVALGLGTVFWVNQNSQNHRIAGLQASQEADRNAADQKAAADAIAKAQAEAESAKSEATRANEKAQSNANRTSTVVAVPPPAYTGAPYYNYNPGYNYLPYQYYGVGVPATTKTSATIRVQPSSTSGAYTELSAGTKIDVQCWVRGEPTYGNDKYGSMWLYLTSGGYVHSFLATPVSVNQC
jgi:hypothetical protein